MKLIRQGLERGMFMTFGEKVRSLRKERKMRKEVENIMIDNQFNIVYSSGGPFHCQLSFIDCQLTKDPQRARTL